jgi:hypothetical protein
MNPVFVTHDGRVLDFEKPKTPIHEAVVKKPEVEESFDVRAQREAAAQSTPLRK